MKKILIGSLAFLLLLTSCESKDDLKNQIAALQEENSSLYEKISNIEEDMDELEAEYETLEDDIDELRKQYNDLLADLTTLEGEISEELKSIKQTMTLLLLENYVLKGDFSSQYKAKFWNLATPLIEEGKTFDEIIALFYTQNVISEIKATNKDKSLLTTISVTKPQISFDQVEVKIFSRDELLETFLLEKEDSFTLSFNAPYYGKFHLITKTTTGDHEIEELFYFGVTTSEYNLVALNATLPVLLFTIDHFANTQDVPTYVYLGREATYNFDKLPESMNLYPPYIGRGGEGALWYPMMDNLSLWVKDLYEMNNDSFFTLNVVDNFINLAFVVFDRFEIPESNYHINIWTDGIFTDTTLNTYKTLDIVNTRRLEIETYRKSIVGIESQNINEPTLGNSMERHGFALALKENVSYFVSSMQGIGTLPLEVKNLMNEVITLKTVASSFEALRSSGNMNAFEHLLKTRWGEEEEEGLSTYFNSPKGKYILIIGTSVVAEASNATNKYYSFDEYIDIVYDTYGSDYEIFYKGHPNYPSSVARKEMFDDKNIIELRNTIPVEIMMYIYPHVYVGGYRGSSFLSSMQDQTLFFFGTQTFIEGQATLKDMILNTTVFDNTTYLFNPSL